MSDPCPPQEKLTVDTSRHRSAASVSTTVSGVADSTISYNTYATGITAESLRLSQFPPPPTAVPSPTSSNPTASSPITPIYRSPQHSAFSHQTTAPLIPRQKGPSSSPPAVPHGPSTWSAGPSSAPGRRDFGRVPPNLHNLASPTSSNASHQGPGSSGHILSPYDWHEGSSSISVDPTEERLLSTSFITGLLSANASSESTESHGVQPQRTAPEADSGSLVSELTYPPSRVVHSPDFPHYPPSYTDTSRTAPIPPNTAPRTTPRSEGETDDLQCGGVDLGIPPEARRMSHTTANMGPFQVRPMSMNSGVASTIHRSSPSTFDSAIPLRLLRSPSTGMASEIEGADVGNIAYNGASSSMMFSPAAPSSAGIRPNSNSKSRERRASTHTTRSQAPSFISRISQSSAGQRSARALKQTMEWLRVKPLPPVPRLPHMALADEEEYRRREAVVPLPALAQRAETLNNMLNAGHLPHRSVGSFSYGNGNSFDKPGDGHAGVLGSSVDVVEDFAHASGRHNNRGGRKRQSLQVLPNRPEGNDTPSPSKYKTFRLASHLTRTGKIKLAVGASILGLLAIIGIVVGVIFGGKHKDSTPSCSGNFTGNACSLDATCVCTSTSSDQCSPLANSLAQLTPIANKILDVNMTPGSVAAAMFAVQGTPVNGNCAAQARVIDVAPALDPKIMPNRTQWAQSALLWSFVQSQDSSAVAKLQQFVQKANWGSLSSSDGPVSDQSSAFQTMALGFVLDFAGQTITEPQVSFENDGQPSSAQVAQVSDAARGALDRMYSFASASSTQQENALKHYWQSELQQDPKNLNLFVSLISSSPILLPFDATASPGGNNISAQLTNSTSAPFPPPLSCYPGLSSSQVQMLNSIETSVFGLSAGSSQKNFDPSCYPNRPIYGVLDVLRLRLPFLDSASGVARQAAVLSKDASPRAVVYVGPILSTLPASSASNISASVATDPLQYGTLNHLNGVLLNFFAAISDINTAIAFVQYVLSSPVVPPVSSSTLGQALGSIPSLEVAVFGSVTPSDISQVVSSFSTPSGGLFFGSDQAEAVRDWAITGTQSNVAWTDSAAAAKIVKDDSLTDANFNLVWDPAFTFLHSDTDAHVDVGNITSAFQSLGMFQP